jgi:hypothetical protein
VIVSGWCSVSVDERPAGELVNHSYFAYWNVEGMNELWRKGRLFHRSQPTNQAGLRELSLSTPDGVYDPDAILKLSAADLFARQRHFKMAQTLRIPGQAAI